MSDPIERQDAINEALKCRVIEVTPAHMLIDKTEMVTKLLALPSAQPEIIHCRDCRWRHDQNGSTAWLPCRAIVTPSDFYCGRAERRTDETD